MEQYTASRSSDQSSPLPTGPWVLDDPNDELSAASRPRFRPSQALNTRHKNNKITPPNLSKTIKSQAGVAPPPAALPKVRKRSPLRRSIEMELPDQPIPPPTASTVSDWSGTQVTPFTLLGRTRDGKEIGGVGGSRKPRKSNALSANSIRQRRFDLPQHVIPPLDMNTVQRRMPPYDPRGPQEEEDEDGHSGGGGRNSPVPSSASAGKKVKASKKGGKLPIELARDLDMIAGACGRAGRAERAGLAFYNKAILFDNAGEFKHAVECYDRFLALCQENKDSVGEALAYNCLGVSYMYLGQLFVAQALEMHTKHAEVADNAGKLMAHINLGIIYNHLGNTEKAMQHHRRALHHAVDLSSLEAEGLACGNLGVTGYRNGNFDVARAYLERQLQVATTLQLPKEEGRAYQNLGRLATVKKDYREASKYYEQAMEVAKKTGDHDLSQIKCNLGIAEGNLRLESYIDGINTDSL